jgi:hypothetical protein
MTLFVWMQVQLAKIFLTLARVMLVGMLPETSCEHGNYLLDRSTLVGDYESPKLGYF